MIVGISAGFHDAALTAIDHYSGKIKFAGHSERFSKNKNDPNLCPAIIQHVQSLGVYEYALYEKPWKRNWQQVVSGKYDFGPWTTKGAIEDLLNIKMPPKVYYNSFSHHLSHAAAGFQTSPFDNAVVMVIDAIGETDTISIYNATYDKNGEATYDRIWNQKYPHSIGLFYSAITHHVGLRPMDEEYILMGMAAYGDADVYYSLLMDLCIADITTGEMHDNFHAGIDGLPDATDEQVKYNLAAAAQKIVEECVMHIATRAKEMSGNSNLVYMGGVALNCVANAQLGEVFDNIWIMPNPGDAGSSLGCAALAYKKRVQWEHPYLGTNIPGDYPVTDLINGLRTDKIVGVASGRAEFGPRALGNRSLLADPRGPEIKDQVNEIKRRQKFRPFAPVILEEFVHEYFEMPKGFDTSPYMQVVAKCKKPDEFPAIVHADGTSRVQTVAKDCGSGIRELLENWYAITGCPMLLNTSLNIRGEPMVDTVEDARRFFNHYGVKVYS